MLATRWEEVHKLVLGSVALEFSLIILTSEFASEVGFRLNETLFLAVFVCLFVLAAVGAYRRRPRYPCSKTGTKWVF